MGTKTTEIKKLRCKKQYGEWYYNIESGGDLDGPIYHLYNSDLERVNTFAYYGDMKYYLETGIVI